MVRREATEYWRLYRRGGDKVKLRLLLKSRKFWAAVLAIVAAVTGAVTLEISWSQAVNLIVGALAAYCVGTGLDNGPPPVENNQGQDRPDGSG